MKKDLTDKEKEERMNYLTIHKCKNENEETESFIRKKFDMPIPDESKEQ